MTMTHATALTGLGISGVSDAALQGWISDAYADQLPGLRADSGDRPSGSQAVEGARLAVRQMVAQQLFKAERGLIGFRADAAIPKWRSIELENAIADGLGLRADASGHVQSGSLRADSYWFREQVTARSPNLIRPNEQPEMARASIDVRTVPAYAEYVQLEYLRETGEAGPIVPGQRDFPRVDFKPERSERKMGWYGIAMAMDWSRAIYSSVPGALDEAAEKARIAVRAIERLQEKFLIQGLTTATGTAIDAYSLTNAPFPTLFSSVNFATATLGAKATEMVRLLQAIRTATDWAGSTPMVGLADPRISQLLRNSNNLDAGGDAVGAGPILRGLAGEGITSIVEAPTLNRFWASPRGANYARMLLWNPGAPGGLQQIIGMAPAPVSTAEYHGTETLYAARWGGLDFGDVSSIAVLDIQVAGS